MLKRYQAKRLRSVTDFRKIKQYITQAKHADKTKAIDRKLKEFAENEDLDIDHLEISSASINAEAKTIGKNASKLLEVLNSIEIDNFVGETELWDSLEELHKLIAKKLREAGRRIR